MTAAIGKALGDNRFIFHNNAICPAKLQAVTANRFRIDGYKRF